MAREVKEEYATDARAVTTLGVRNVLRGEPVSHWVAVLFAVEPGTVEIGEPHKFDALGWFPLDALPSPRHSQLDDTLEMFGTWLAAERLE
ncbi:NUDIX domain-containing protein [Actinopolymorpha sp. NPDC004070]|uniref:NUDIX domain-containing protein n=1 Tax=Actinopolymorpha sp. NPDC004070 TaxID=3154548 RepID=UPI0033BB677F